MSDVECFTRLFDMMYINGIILFFGIEKDIHFLKSFYNSLTIIKNRL